MKFISTFSLLIFLILSPTLSAQEIDEVRVGEVLKIGIADTYEYSDVKFPKANFIIKKGEIVNYKKLVGTLVEVTEVKTNNNGNTVVILRKKNGEKFFGSFPEIRANYKEALASGELSRS